MAEIKNLFNIDIRRCNKLTDISISRLKITPFYSKQLNKFSAANSSLFITSIVISVTNGVVSASKLAVTIRSVIKNMSTMRIFERSDVNHDPCKTFFSRKLN